MSFLIFEKAAKTIVVINAMDRLKKNVSVTN